MSDSARNSNELTRLRAVIENNRQAGGNVQFRGAVMRVGADTYSVRGLSRHVRLGDTVALDLDGTELRSEVIRIGPEEILVKPLESWLKVGIGTPAYSLGQMVIHPDETWLGRIVNAVAQPIDDKGPLQLGDQEAPIERQPPAPLQRARITESVRTGIHAVDLFAPVCKGQRVGVFSGSGVGKSSLLAMFAKSSGFDVNIIALVGERGREVREFIEDALGDNIKKSILVIATSDESAMMRRLAPKTAMAIAEYFAGAGQSVMFVMDSATRFAQAARDAAMASGEPAIARGYTPSVFNELPRLFERAGPGRDGAGSITAIISVLVEGETQSDPLADSIRGILDGHIMLERSIADQGRYPAINILSSISRLARIAWTPEQAQNVLHLKRLVSRFEDTRDLRLMGGYTPGADLELDNAVSVVPKIYDALGQDLDDALDVTTDPFQRLADRLAEAIGEG